MLYPLWRSKVSGRRATVFSMTETMVLYRIDGEWNVTLSCPRAIWDAHVEPYVIT